MAHVVLASLLFATFIVWNYILVNIREKESLQFESEARNILSSVEKRLDICFQVFRGFEGFFAASRSVERDEFRTYAQKIEFLQDYPGLAGVLYVERVSADKGEECAVVKYVEPPVEGLLGFDYLTQEAQRGAYLDARDTGQPRAVKMSLHRGEYEDGRSIPTIGIIFPIYGNGFPVQTPEERRQALQGFVTGVFPVSELFRGFFGASGLYPNMSCDVFYGETLKQQSTLFHADARSTDLRSSRDPLKFKGGLDVGGQRWIFYFSSTVPPRLSGVQRALPVFVLVGGVTMSFLAFGIFYLLTTLNARSIGLARKMTRDLKESEQRFRWMSETSPLGIFLADDRGDYLYMNPVCQKIMGMSFQQALGEGWGNGIHPEDRERVLRQWYETAKQKKPFESIHRFLRENKTVAWVAVKASAVVQAGDAVAGYVGTMEDVTDRKQVEDRLAMMNDCLLGLGPDSWENMKQLVALSGRILGGDYAYYDQLKGDLLCTANSWSLSSACQMSDSTKGRISRDVVQSGTTDSPLMIVDLLKDSSAEEDSDGLYARFESCVGQVVSCNGLPVGALCVAYRENFELSESDKGIIGIVASAIGVEEDRIRAEEELRANARHQNAVAQISQWALPGMDLDALASKTSDILARTLEVDYCKILELLPDGKELLLRAGWGWKKGSIGNAAIELDKNSLEGYTLLQKSEMVVVEDLSQERRFEAPPLLKEHGVVSGMSIAIPGADGLFGVMEVHTTQRRRFTEKEKHLLQAVATVLSVAVQRKKMEEMLEEKLRELEFLNRVMMDREERILELKGQIESLKGNADGPAPVLNPEGSPWKS